MNIIKTRFEFKSRRDFLMGVGVLCFRVRQDVSRHHLKVFIVCLSYCLLMPMSVFTTQDTLILNTAISYPLTTTAQAAFVDKIVRLALQRIGYDEESVQLPAERALKNANSGLDDGDLLRIGGLSKTYPNLIQVPEKIIDLEFVVFSKQKNMQIVEWKDLSPYTVAIITGWKILERNITSAATLTKVKNVEQLFTLLAKDRVDVLVYSRWVGLGYLEKHNADGVKVLGAPLATRPMYVYLHKKHQQIGRAHV